MVDALAVVEFIAGPELLVELDSDSVAGDGGTTAFAASLRISTGNDNGSSRSMRRNFLKGGA